MINPEEALSLLASGQCKRGSVPDGPWTTEEKRIVSGGFWTFQNWLCPLRPMDNQGETLCP